MRVLLIFKSAHEIATLSWFFYIKVKEQEINMNPLKDKMIQNRNLTFASQLLKLICK